MVAIKSALIAGLLLTGAAAVEQKKIKAATYNEATHEIDITYEDGSSAELGKRDYGYHYDYGYGQNTHIYLVNLLRQRREWEFCKAYINLRPTVTKVATIKSCGKGNPRCLPVTFTKKVTEGSQTTLTLPFTEVVTTTLTTDVTTITAGAPTPTVVETTSTTIVLTSTVGTPLETPAPAPAPAPPPAPADERLIVPRGMQPPKYIRHYNPAQISSACSDLVRHVIKTQTRTVTKTIPGYFPTDYVTLTVPGLTTTFSVTKTTTSTSSVVITPATTVTVTPAPTTVTSVATETQTVTICPGRLYPGASGVSRDNSGDSRIIFPALAKNSPVNCCSYCYYNMQGCNFWAGGETFCFIVMNGNGPEPSTTCPNGRGAGSLLISGTGTLNQETSGGDGPCAGDYQKVMM
ncbi:hypothetical protein BZA77DRAFT_46335 [Pyronema omphalodes]|nr:hypothetical protein BZA77DRAFT_46335 [Pyronema omphalodes]